MLVNSNIDIGTRVQKRHQENAFIIINEAERRLRVSVSCLSYLLANWLGLARLGVG